MTKWEIEYTCISDVREQLLDDGWEPYAVVLIEAHYPDGSRGTIPQWHFRRPRKDVED